MLTTPTPRWARVAPRLVVVLRLLIVCVGDLGEWRWRRVPPGPSPRVVQVGRWQSKPEVGQTGTITPDRVPGNGTLDGTTGTRTLLASSVPIFSLISLTPTSGLLSLCSRQIWSEVLDHVHRNLVTGCARRPFILAISANASRP